MFISDYPEIKAQIQKEYREWCAGMSLDPESDKTKELYDELVSWWRKAIMLKVGQEIFKGKSLPETDGPKNIGEGCK